MSATPSSESSDKAGEPSSVHRPSSSSGNGEATTDASPPGKRAKIADFATALMRACSVELPPAEREERISATADAREGERMESGVFPGKFNNLAKPPTEKIINDW